MESTNSEKVLDTLFQLLQVLIPSEVPDLDPEKVLQTNADKCSLVEVGAGNMNYVARLTVGNGSYIVKYAPPYIKIIGPEAPISADRVVKEYNCMKKFHEICPGSVPKPLYVSQEKGILIMEDLTHHEVMKFAMKEMRLDMTSLKNLVLNVAMIHSSTHVTNMADREFRDMIENHRNYDLMEGLTKEYVFERPYDAKDSTNRTEPEVDPVAQRIRNNPNILSVRDKFKDTMFNKKECLLHGDLHNGSVMVHGQDARIIDSEFCTVGPAAWDVSYIIGHLLFCYYYHVNKENGDGSHKAFADLVASGVNLVCKIYQEKMMPKVENLSAFYNDFYSELAGFLGIELIRRTMGVAHPEDISGHGEVEKLAIEAGENLLLKYEKINSHEALLQVLGLDSSS